jgi:peptide/nickel transport system substrate-binding protein
VITVALVSSPNNLDPRVGTDEVSQRIHQLIFDPLLAIDSQLRVVPGLAEGWEMPDNRTYLVRLRKGVPFHDGHELTSADVVYTFSTLLDPAFLSPRKGAYRMVQSVTARDRYTVEFFLNGPFASFPVNLVMGVVPAGWNGKTPPVGTGPYRFVSATADDRVVLESFPRYYRGAPRNQGLVLRIIPDDVMRGLELRRGSVDLVVNDLAPDIVYQLQSEGHLQVVKAPGTDYAYLGFNLRDSTLADQRVRQAIGFAIDRGAIIEHLRRGLAIPALGVLPPASWAFNPDVFTFAYDPARARALLDEAGYRPRAPDGIRLRLSLKVSSSEFNRLQSAVIQQNLREVGIELDVRTYEFATLYADVLGGNFQMFTLQWVGVSDPDMLRRVFHSKQVPPTGFNRGYFKDAEVDRLIDEATVSTDDAVRQQLYGRVQAIVARAAPYVSLWDKVNVAVAQPGLRGVTLAPAADFTFLRDVYRERTKR